MSFTTGNQVEFSQPVRQIVSMLTVLALVGVGAALLGSQIKVVLLANPYLNGFILAVFLFGVGATFWQMGRLIAALRWIRNLQTGLKGHEFSRPPSLVISMAPLLREGRFKQRLTATSTRSILDSIAVRLDESRDITRYISNLLIFLGLLGTFWGLSITVPAVIETIRALEPRPGDTGGADVFSRLMTGLEAQLGGMGTAFAASLVGLAGSLVVGLLDLFAGHGQNRFYRELEEWLTSFTRLGLVAEGEGPEGALIALLERVDDGLQRTVDFAERAEVARIEAENRLGRAADVVAAMADQIEHERAHVTQLITEMRVARDLESGRDHATLGVLKRIDHSLSNQAGVQQQVVQLFEQALHDRSAAKVETLLRGSLDGIDRQLRGLVDEITVGRAESTAQLRDDFARLIALIDDRTRDPNGAA